MGRGAACGVADEPEGAVPAAPSGSVHDTSTVVSANAAWSGTGKRATPAGLVVISVAGSVRPSAVPFQIARLNRVDGGSPPML